MGSRTTTAAALSLIVLGGCTFYTGGGFGDGYDRDGELPEVPEAPGDEGEPGSVENDPGSGEPDAPPDDGGLEPGPVDDDSAPDAPPSPDENDDPVVEPSDDPAPGPVGCDPPCGAGEECLDGECVVVTEHEDASQYCVDLTNQYRSDHGRSSLARSSDLEDCATEGAEFDSTAWFAHAHFSRTNGCGGVADAENECPGWSGDVVTVIRECLAMMMAEGPGGGHYENILGDHTSVGCGIYVTPRGSVWVVQDFK